MEWQPIETARNVHRLGSLRPPAGPVPLPPSFVTCQEVFGFKAGRPVAFNLRRAPRMGGTEVGLIFDSGLWVNVSAQMTIWPRSFSAARQWVMALAQRYHLDLREMPCRGWRDMLRSPPARVSGTADGGTP